MGRKARSDSVQSALNAMIAVTLPDLEVPKHVRMPENAKPFWSDIIASRARDEWAKNDLVVAAQLARCQLDIENESVLLEAEGSVIENQRGTPVMNPRHAVLEQLARREMALMRALGMNAAAGSKDRSAQQSARKSERQAAALKETLVDDELLAN